MRWTIPASACLIAAALVGCNKNRANGAAETGSMTDTAGMAAPADTSAMNRSADTGMRGMGTSDTGTRGAGTSDTSHMKSGASRMHPDTSKPASNDSTKR